MSCHTSRCISSLQCLTLAVLCLLLSPAELHAQRRLTLSDALKLAMDQNTQLRLEQAKVAESEANRKSTRGLYGPRLLLDANVMIWDSAQAFDFDMSSLFNMDLDPSKLDPTKLGLNNQDMATLQKYGDLLAVVPKLIPALTGDSSSSGMTVRDQVTAQVQVALAQPLTPLLQIHKGYTASRHMRKAAGLNLEAQRIVVARQVAETYLKMMQAKRFVSLADTGVKQVEAHLARAQHFFKAEVIGKQQVLKAQLELARARERSIKARYGVSLAGSGLALLLGLSPMTSIEPTEQLQDPPPPINKSLSECLRLAQKQRHELRSMKQTRYAAEAGKDALKWGLLPQVSVMATYQHNWGQETFSPADVFFAGGMLKWEVWDWGHKYYSMKAAGHKARQAELGLKLLQDGVVMQVKKAYLDLKQADEALKVSRKAIKEAEENFRIEQMRFEANSNTSTDVLDAQLALTRSRLTYNNSLYSHYIARAALVAAMGSKPRVPR